MAPPTRQSRDPNGDLGALLELERSLAVRLAEARAEAARILATAAEEIAGREAAFAADLAKARGDLEVRLAGEQERQLALVRDEARRRIAEWDGIDQARVERAAATVADALVAGPRGARR